MLSKVAAPIQKGPRRREGEGRKKKRKSPGPEATRGRTKRPTGETEKEKRDEGQERERDVIFTPASRYFPAGGRLVARKPNLKQYRRRRGSVASAALEIPCWAGWSPNTTGNYTRTPFRPPRGEEDGTPRAFDEVGGEKRGDPEGDRGGGRGRGSGKCVQTRFVHTSCRGGGSQGISRWRSRSSRHYLTAEYSCTAAKHAG